MLLRRCQLVHISEVSSKLPDSKAHGANMGPIWGRQDPGGPHVGPMNFVSRVHIIGSICVWILLTKGH